MDNHSLSLTAPRAEWSWSPLRWTSHWLWLQNHSAERNPQTSQHLDLLLWLWPSQIFLLHKHKLNVFHVFHWSVQPVEPAAFCPVSPNVRFISLATAPNIEIRPVAKISQQGGQKPQKGVTCFKYNIRCMQHPVGQTCSGGHIFPMGSGRHWFPRWWQPWSKWAKDTGTTFFLLRRRQDFDKQTLIRLYWR